MLIDVYIDLVGSSRTQAEMIKSLAGIIKDEDNFEKSFRESVALDTGKKNINNNKQSTNRVNDLIEASRVFTIEKQQYIFDELENIFFLDKPIN